MLRSSAPHPTLTIVVTGAMPPGGLAELKRRKQGAERAASGDVKDNADEKTPEEPAEQQPGELQHVSRALYCDEHHHLGWSIFETLPPCDI